MQPSLPTKPQPEPKNNCPDCLYMKLEGIPVQPGSQDSIELWCLITNTEQIDLLLTINFSEQWETLKQGRVKFGLKSGELRVRLKNGEIPLEYRELTGSVELSLPKERQKPKPSKGKKGQEIPPRAPNLSLNGSQPKAQVNVGAGQKPARVEPYPASVCHITTKVSEENPVWVFEQELGEPVLKGFLKQAKLATLNVSSLPCHIEVTFEVSKRDVCLTDAEGLWPPDISRNKRAVLDRLIVQRLLEPKLKPYLSRAELHYD